MNAYGIEFLARDRLDQFAREARADGLLRTEPGTGRSWLATIGRLLRRPGRRPGIDVPSASAARPNIV
jgi:hypothetical protein